MASDVDQVRLAANRVNTSLMAYIMSLTDEDGKTDHSFAPHTLGSIRESSSMDRRDSSLSGKITRLNIRDPTGERSSGRKTPVDMRPSTPTVDDRTPSPRPVSDLDYDAAVNALTLQFLNEHEATRVAALQWLIMLHRKAPRRVC